jgi:hypothetical protein
MPADRRISKQKREPNRRYADRRQAKALRAIVEELVQRGEIEVVDTVWGREFRRLRYAPKERG